MATNLKMITEAGLRMHHCSLKFDPKFPPNLDGPNSVWGGMATMLPQDDVKFILGLNNEQLQMLMFGNSQGIGERDWLVYSARCVTLGLDTEAISTLSFSMAAAFDKAESGYQIGLTTASRKEDPSVPTLVTANA